MMSTATVYSQVEKMLNSYTTWVQNKAIKKAFTEFLNYGCWATIEAIAEG